jgi:hypothetical protein
LAGVKEIKYRKATTDWRMKHSPRRTRLSLAVAAYRGRRF